MSSLLSSQETLNRLDNAVGWLTRSYEITGGRGFSIGFEFRRGWLAAYSETTGYIIPSFYRYAQLFNKNHFSDIATNAAAWLVSIQSDEGWFPVYSGRLKKPHNCPPVIFDTAQDIFGLLGAWKTTSNHIFLDAAYKAGVWIEKQQSKDGLWHSPGFGVGDSASYYTHVTWPLLLLANEVNNSAISDCATRGLEAIAARSSPNGQIEYWGFERKKPAFTHTIAYTIEGLLEQGLLYGHDNVAIQIARKAADLILSLVERDGRLAGSYDVNWNGDYSYICTPGNCQIALLFVRLFKLYGDKRFIKGADLVLKAILPAQCNASFLPLAIHGNMPASWPPFFGKYQRYLFPNWAAKYLADALISRYCLEDEDGKVGETLEELLNRYPG